MFPILWSIFLSSIVYADLCHLTVRLHSLLLIDCMLRLIIQLYACLHLHRPLSCSAALNVFWNENTCAGLIIV